MSNESKNLSLNAGCHRELYRGYVIVANKAPDGLFRATVFREDGRPIWNEARGWHSFWRADARYSVEQAMANAKEDLDSFRLM
jgi:hypothetical protein